MAQGIFATAVNCMDGRTQLPVIEWMKEKFGVDYVDSVTEPGPDGIIARGEPQLIDSIKTRVLISVEKHGSKAIVIVGHHDCAGNPGDKEMHLDHVRKAVEEVQSWHLKADIYGVWVGEDWTVEEIGKI